MFALRAFPKSKADEMCVAGGAALLGWSLDLEMRSEDEMGIKGEAVLNIEVIFVCWLFKLRFV